MKAISVGMIFGMIFTIIIIGIVLSVGMGQMTQFFCVGSNTQTSKAVNDIESMVSEVFILAKGSAKTYQLNLPSDTAICFINETNPGPHPYFPDTTKTWNPDPLILENFLENPNSPAFGSNMWIYLCDNPLGEQYKMKHLSPSKSFCAVGGRTLFLENMGRSVDISIPE